MLQKIRHHLSRLERFSCYFRVYSDYFVGWLCNIVFVYQLVKQRRVAVESTRGTRVRRD